jgi:uncharacterized protein (DUF2267 family)
MSQRAIFEHGIEETHVWLSALKEFLQTTDEDSACAALRAVLRQLRDRLSIQEAVDLGAQLPILLRGDFYEHFMPQRTPEPLHNRADFLSGVAANLRGHKELDPETATRAVFALLEMKIARGEVDDVMDALPKDIRPLWPSAAQERSLRRRIKEAAL